MTMNRKTHTHLATSALMLLLTLIATGCSFDEVIEQQKQQDQRMAVSFAPSFNQVSTRAKTTLDNIWPDGTEISISNGLGKTYTYKAETASGEATALVPVTDIIYWENPRVKFSAWYPVATVAPTNHSVAADQSAGQHGLDNLAYQKQDLLYCPPEITTFTYQQLTPITLTFHHQLARVIVKVNSSFTEGQYPNKEKVESIVFGGGQLGLTGDITPSTTGENGTTGWTITDSKNSSITMRNVSVESEVTDNLYTFECMVLPQKSDSETNLIVVSTSGSVDSDVNGGKRTYTYKSAFDLKSGYQYTYNLVVSEQGSITFATVEVEDWETGPTVVNDATIPDNSYPGI